MSTRANASGEWPVTDDGWQVTDLRRTLYPGGPFACKVMTPDQEFFFGIGFEPPAEAVERAVVTNFGRSSINLPFHEVLTTEAARRVAESQVRAYLLTYWQLVFPLPVRGSRVPGR